MNYAAADIVLDLTSVIISISGLEPWKRYGDIDDGVVFHTSVHSSTSSLLSIVPDDDISVGFRLLRALLVGERIVQ